MWKGVWIKRSIWLNEFDKSKNYASKICLLIKQQTLIMLKDFQQLPCFQITTWEKVSVIKKSIHI